MLDPRFFNENISELENGLKRRNADSQLISAVSELSKRRKTLVVETEKLKALRNATSQEIAQLKGKAKADPAAALEADKKVAAMRGVGDQIKSLDEELKAVEESKVVKRRLDGRTVGQLPLLR